jgi:hypothetical protein
LHAAHRLPDLAATLHLGTGEDSFAVCGHDLGGKRRRLNADVAANQKQDGKRLPAMIEAKSRADVFDPWFSLWATRRYSKATSALRAVPSCRP